MAMTGKAYLIKGDAYLICMVYNIFSNIIPSTHSFGTMVRHAAETAPSHERTSPSHVRAAKHAVRIITVIVKTITVTI